MKKGRKKKYSSRQTSHTSPFISTLGGIALTFVLLFIAPFFEGCSKVKLYNPKPAHATSPSPSPSPSEALTSAFAIVPGAQISTGTGMMVIGTVGEPVAMPSSGVQTAPGMQVIPGVRGMLFSN